MRIDPLNNRNRVQALDGEDRIVESKQSWKSSVLVSRICSCFFDQKQPIKPILRKKKSDSSVRPTDRHLRFRDSCRTSYPALAFFSEDGRCRKLHYG